ncbi:MAG: UvrD-helicase domain-containing protein [Hyphomonadaceae bacterium]|nr:UvrD-helicase domain-containing protein [Hyphomonadaceae bacterium]
MSAADSAPIPERSSERKMSISERAMAGMSRGAPYLEGLNPEQKEAVENLDGPVLVLAGAGTGKTRVLTCRLAHILSLGKAFPSQILSVTFTNKAAREMRERCAGLLGNQVEGLPWLGTFHSIAAKILRIHAELAGLKSSFTILDTDDQLRLLKQILRAENIDEKRWTPRHLAHMIDGWKNKGLTPDRLTGNDGFSFAGGKGKALYTIYQNRLKTLNACDFGDLLLHNITIFQKYPDVLQKYHAKFKYLLVDEYQDTNVAQYLWLRLLAQGSQNLCVVGDDDQSIYGWRGAEVDNILRFEKDFPGAKVIRLERNYRSTEHILAAASGLISANEDRLGKTLWTEEQGGEKVGVSGVWDGTAEARVIAGEIENWKSTGRVYNDVAVLVRASRQMRSFEERFIMLGLPYRVIGGPRFFERAEIRDAHAYLRTIRSETDDLAFERIVNTPKRGIGATSIQKLQVAARAMGVSLENATRQLVKTDEIRGKARSSLRAFLLDIDRWRTEMRAISHTELAEKVLDESGYTQMWREDKSPKAEGRLENLKELIQAMGEFETLDAYMEHVSLVLDAETGETEDEISLMTLHAAKGLEFPLVFLPGWEDGTFPSQKSLDENGMAGLEEERRLAYVGLTRARERAHIYFAANRQIYGQWQSSIPSRFIDELPAEHVDVESETGYYGNAASQQFSDSFSKPEFGGSFSEPSSPGWQRYKKNAQRAPTIEGTAIKRKAKDSGLNFVIGERIFHQKFGYGKIVSADGNKLEVKFEKAGSKKVLDSFVEKA